MMTERHRRINADEWQTHIFTESDKPCAFESIGFTMRLANIYCNVRFDETYES